MDEPDIAPDGTMMLEPRDMYDQAYLGVVNQGGIYYAVYSREKCIELLYEEAMGVATPQEIEDGGPYTDAVEHFEFNVSGSIGVGFPVFWSGTESWEAEEE